MIVIGLTGIVGSGKSTVASLLKEDKYVKVIDVDEIAHAILAKGTSAHGKVVAAFGKKVTNKDGSIDRAALGKIIFSDAEARKTLNGITHLSIGMQILKQLLVLQFTGAQYVVIDAPLLLETPLQYVCDEILIVNAPVETMVKRIVARGKGLTEADATAMVATQNTAEHQANVDKMVKSYTLNIENVGTMEELTSKANSALRQCKSNSGPLSMGRLTELIAAIIFLPFLIWYFLF